LLPFRFEPPSLRLRESNATPHPNSNISRDIPHLVDRHLTHARSWSQIALVTKAG